MALTHPTTPSASTAGNRSNIVTYPSQKRIRKQSHALTSVESDRTFPRPRFRIYVLGLHSDCGAQHCVTRCNTNASQAYRSTSFVKVGNNQKHAISGDQHFHPSPKDTFLFGGTKLLIFLVKRFLALGDAGNCNVTPSS